uniref:Uncharacterized protein n=1 Tax=Arundo donax TaxID=35708 RepID=A0A0A9AMF0_ARUDO
MSSLRYQLLSRKEKKTRTAYCCTCSSVDF